MDKIETHYWAKYSSTLPWQRIEFNAGQRRSYGYPWLKPGYYHDNAMALITHWNRMAQNSRGWEQYSLTDPTKPNQPSEQKQNKMNNIKNAVVVCTSDIKFRAAEAIARSFGYRSSNYKPESTISETAG